MTTLITTVRTTFNHLSFPSHDVPATAAFFERFLGFTVLAMGNSRVVKKDQLDIVLEDARDRDVQWPGNFHVGVEVATREDLARLFDEMREAGVPMETDVFAHARGSRFFCWMPGRLMLEVNTREDAAPEFRRTFASQQG
ncbi:VOC family protein [Roseateles sp. So40a]|uniref:VOC family protein n=1 Tax=Roseateles sp. So40a TaxID=3400226 RepID=UPI003A899E17